MLGIALLLGGTDDGDQFEARVEPVAVQQYVCAVVDERGWPDERRGDAIAPIVLPSQALEGTPKLRSIARRRQDGLDSVRVEELQIEHVRGAVHSDGFIAVAQLAH